MADKKQRLVLAILDFLSDSMDDGTVMKEDREGVEVAAQSIAEAFGVDPTNAQQRELLSVKPANLMSIFDVYLKTRDKVSAPPKPAVLPDIKAQAEKLKQTGNAQMSRKDYAEAIQSYTEAISLDPTSAVYYSNRAAAYSSQGNHQKAVEDAEKAIEVDPQFVKAFSRLGHAHYSLGDFVSASSAFQRGLKLDPSNSNLKIGLEQAEARISNDTAVVGEETSSNSDGTAPTGSLPDMGGLASMLGGMGGGAGGVPDLSSMMNNPAIMQMAQNMMANGGMERLMQNPAIANMMNRVQSGGGMPSMEELISDPTLRNLANSFGAGGAGGAGRGGV